MKTFFLAILLILTVVFFVQAQSGSKQKEPDGKKNRREQTTTNEKLVQANESEQISPDEKAKSSEIVQSADDEIVRVDTDLVTVPVTVSDREGRFVIDLKKEDFEVFENGKPQTIEYFATTETPFTVALVLDTSQSAKFKIDEIQTAAYQFVMGLRPADRVMVVSFDQDVRILSQPTSDREVLRQAIKQTRFAGGTSLYEAVYAALERMNKISGRKAIVLFTDGVDTTSRKTNGADNLYQTQEFEGIIYPIYYNTYEDVQVQLRNPPPILNPNPVPGAPVPFPTQKPTIPGTNFPLPTLPGQIRRPRDQDASRYPRDPNDPNDSRYPQPSNRRDDDPTNTDPRDSGGSVGLPGSGTSAREYREGKQYLDKLAANTGGRLYQADTYGGLGRAFDQIAEELRRQYSLGYYPAVASDAGERRTLTVKVNRKKVSVRARDGYIAGKKKTAKS